MSNFIYRLTVHEKLWPHLEHKLLSFCRVPSKTVDMFSGIFFVLESTTLAVCYIQNTCMHNHFCFENAFGYSGNIWTE